MMNLPFPSPAHASGADSDRFSLWPQGAGLGLRRSLLPELEAEVLSGADGGLPAFDFFEIAPENWMTMGGRYQRQLSAFTERFPFVCHGLSLSLGAVQPLNTSLLHDINAFMRTHRIACYTEHLAWCSDDGQLYDLLPIPCTEEAVTWVAARIRDVQAILGRRIGIENASYYLTPPGAEMDEATFIHRICVEADCDLHLDVNNVYVNSRNFGFDPVAYLQALPLDRVCYMHVAGHYVAPEGGLVDTHGAAVIDPVWQLLIQAYALMGRIAPTCLERDFNFPPLSVLQSEVAQIRGIQAQYRTPDPYGRLSYQECDHDVI